MCKTQAKLVHRNFVYVAQKAYCTKKQGEKSNSEEVTKESLQWRTPRDQIPGEWYSKLKVFAGDSNNADFVKFMQSPINLWPSTIKKWFIRKEEETERHMQQFIPERNQILGDNLAAAHFIVYRGGSVKFHGQTEWVKQDQNLEYKLPNKYVPHLKIQAIDCSNVRLYYEGLVNFRGLQEIQWFSVNSCSEMDDWCLDSISGMFKDSLQYLDIRNCMKITDRGVGALYRMSKLRTLLIDDQTRTKELELTCLMLQELNPQLQIKSE